MLIYVLLIKFLSKEIDDQDGKSTVYISHRKYLQSKTDYPKALGNAYQSLGDYQKATKYHKRDLKIAIEIGDRAIEGRAYGNLGILTSRWVTIERPPSIMKKI